MGFLFFLGGVDFCVKAGLCRRAQELHKIGQGEGFDEGKFYTRKEYQMYSEAFRRHYLDAHPHVEEEARDRLLRKTRQLESQLGRKLTEARRRRFPACEQRRGVECPRPPLGAE